MAIKNNKLGGTDYSTPTARVKPTDLNDTNDAIINTVIGHAQNAYQTLQANNVFENKDFLATDEFIDADGTNNTVNLIETSAYYDSGNDNYEVDSSVTTNPFIIIEATSISSTSDFSINDCIINKIDTGKWQLVCNSGTEEVRRAKLYKTLFYGTYGTDPRASSTYITSITALKTNITRDVGKDAYLMVGTWERSGASPSNAAVIDATFAGTTGNTDVSSWSLVTAPISSGTTNNDEFGTDRSADEKDNPATARFFIPSTNYICQWEMPNSTVLNTVTGDSYSRSGMPIRAFILSEEAVTWTANTYGTISSEIDFSTDNSIPTISLATETIQYIVISDTNTLTLDGTEKSICLYVDATNTSMTVLASDGINETNAQTITNNTSTVFNITSLSSGTLKLQFNLSDSTEFYGYGVFLIR